MNTGQGFLDKLGNLSRSYYGMMIAHIGVAVFIIGVALVKGYEVEKDVRMDIGDVVKLGGHVFRFDGVTDVTGPNYRANRGTVTVTDEQGDFVTMLYPEKRIYNVQQQPMTEAAIDSGLLRHLYVSLGEPVSAGAWSVRVYYKPFVNWIWGGCVFMGLGGMLAISDRRYRLARRQRKAERATDSKEPAVANPAVIMESKQ